MDNIALCACREHHRKPTLDALSLAAGAVATQLRINYTLHAILIRLAPALAINNVLRGGGGSGQLGTRGTPAERAPT